MKYVVAKISKTIKEKPYLAKKLFTKINEICVMGTLSAARINMQQISFKIEDRNEALLSEFLEFENFEVRNIAVSNPPPAIVKHADI